MRNAQMTGAVLLLGLFATAAAAEPQPSAGTVVPVTVDNFVDGWLVFIDAVLRPNELNRDYAKTRPSPLNSVHFVMENGAFAMRPLMPDAPTSIRAKKIEVMLREKR